MSEAKTTEDVTKVRLLALLLAGLIWLAVILERPAELKLQVPVTVGQLPTGLRLVSAPPGTLEVTVSGPRILLLRPWLMGANCALDLSGAQPGSASYSSRECGFGLDRELRVLRVSPALLHLAVSKAQ